MDFLVVFGVLRGGNGYYIGQNGGTKFLRSNFFSNLYFEKNHQLAVYVAVILIRGWEKRFLEHPRSKMHQVTLLDKSWDNFEV